MIGYFVPRRVLGFGIVALAGLGLGGAASAQAVRQGERGQGQRVVRPENRNQRQQGRFNTQRTERRESRTTRNRGWDRDHQVYRGYGDRDRRDRDFGRHEWREHRGYAPYYGYGYTYSEPQYYGYSAYPEYGYDYYSTPGYDYYYQPAPQYYAPAPDYYYYDNDNPQPGINLNLNFGGDEDQD